MPRVLSQAAIAAKELRQQLKAAYPAVKFSVKTHNYSMGESIRVNWVDGPTADAIDAIASQYERVRRDASGEILSGGTRYIHLDRSYSPAAYRAAVCQVADDCDVAAPAVQIGSGDRPYIDPSDDIPNLGNGSEYFSWLVRQELAELDLLKTPASVSADLAPDEASGDTIKALGSIESPPPPLPVRPKSKLSSNKAALRLIRDLQAQERQPTAVERDILLRYVGNGSIAHAIDREYLDLCLDPRAGLESDNAFQTPPDLLAAGWRILEALGFTHGRILSPSANIGTQIESQPLENRSRSEWVLVEINPDAAAIARALHPDAIAIYGSKPDQRIGFENVEIPEGSFDLVYDNFPFGAAEPFDPKYAGLGLNLHNYFWLKSIDSVRLGGIVAAFTSTSTLDNSEFCQLLRDRGAQLIGAVRLPSDAFKSMGTQVTADFVVLQKVAQPSGPNYSAMRSSGIQNQHGADLPINQYFVEHPDRILGSLTLSKLYGGQAGLAVEPDGRDLPAAMLAAFADCKPCYQAEPKPRSLRDSLLDESLIGISPYSFIDRDGKIYQFIPQEGLKLVTQHADRIRAAIALKRSLDALVGLETSDADEDAIEAARTELNGRYDRFIDQYGHLLNNRKRPSTLRILEDDSELHAMLFALEQAIEHEPDAGSSKPWVEYRKQDIFFKRISGRLQSVDLNIETAIDAVNYCLNQLGRLDLPFIAGLIGKSIDQAIADLNSDGAGEAKIFYCPQAKEWQLRSHYLSGNTREKLKLVRAIAQIDRDQYEEQHLHYNEAALSARDGADRYIHLSPYLLPPCSAQMRATIAQRLKSEQDVDAELSAKLFISAGLGTPWLNPADIAQFVAQLIGVEAHQIRCDYAAGLALWAIGGDWQAQRYGQRSEYATPERSVLELVELALNQQKIQIDIWVKVDGQSVKDKDASQKATDAAIAQSERIKDRFKKWLWEDGDRCWEYTQIYNQLFPRPRKRDYGAPWLNLPGSNTAIVPRSHQRAAINRILQDRSTLLLHEVGVGKTLCLIGSSYEAKRIGRARKPMLVVLKSTLSQIVGTYRSLYPHARLLVAEGEDKNRLYAKIQTGDYDCIIVTHDQFYAVPVSAQTKIAYIEEQLSIVREYLDDTDKADRLLRRELESQERSLEAAIDEIATLEAIEQASNNPAQLKKLLQELLAKEQIKVDDKGRVQYCRQRGLSGKEQKLEDKRRDRLTASVDRAMHHYASHTIKGVEWERLGIDFVAFDEMHNLKNLKVSSKLIGVAGVSMPDTQRTLNSLLKFRHTADRGGAIVGATGTMPTNTVAELYVMQRFFDPKELDRTGTKHFDAWVGQFAEPTTQLEFSSTGGIKAKTRICRFKNMPQLMDMLRQFTDLMTADRAGIKRPTPHKITLSARPSEDQLEVIAKIGDYMRMWQSGKNKGAKYQTADGRIVEHNPLTLTNHGSQNAIDPRLVEPTASNDFESKINLLIHNAWHVWQASQAIKGAQLIFCDTGTPDSSKAGRFGVYVYVRDALIALGVPPEEIAFIHDYSDRQRAKLFADVNAGKVRFLLASTEKGGTGVNVQERCVALHHLDLSWTPAKQEQRNGRGHRQGNILPAVWLFYYGTTGRGDQPGFDAYKAKLVSDKAAFIYQIMSDAIADCVVDDIGDDAAMYMMAAAILSGNGQALEHAKLSDQIRRIEADLDQQNETAVKATYGLERLPQVLAEARDRAISAQQDQQAAIAIGDLNGKAFCLKLRDRLYTNFTDASSALAAEVAICQQNGSAIPTAIGRAGDLSIQIEKRWGGAYLSVVGQLTYSCKNPTIAGIKAAVEAIAHGVYVEEHENAVRQYERDEASLPDRIRYLTGEIDRLKAELEPLHNREAELRRALQASAAEEAEGAQKARKLPSANELIPAPTPALYVGIEPECVAHLKSKGEPIAHDADGSEIRWIGAIEQVCQRLAAGGQETALAVEVEAIELSAPPQVEPLQAAPPAAEPPSTTAPEPKPIKESSPPKPKARSTKAPRKGNVIRVDFQKHDPNPSPIEPETATAKVQPPRSGDIRKALNAIERTVRKQFAGLGYEGAAVDRIVAAAIEAAKQEMGLIAQIDGFRYEDMAIGQGRGRSAIAGALQGSLF